MITRAGAERSQVRAAALDALGAIGDHAAPHAEAVAGLLVDPDARVRTRAVAVLRMLGSEYAGPFVAAIAGRLWDDDGYVRLTAVNTLGELEAEAAPHIPGLISRLEDDDEEVGGPAVSPSKLREILHTFWGDSLGGLWQNGQGTRGAQVPRRLSVGRQSTLRGGGARGVEGAAVPCAMQWLRSSLAPWGSR